MPVLLDTSVRLAHGPRVRLRHPHVRDRTGVAALLTRIGLGADDLDLQRALRFDPRVRAVLCATIWTVTGETVVGLGAISYGAEHADLLLVDEALAPGLREILLNTLALAGARRRAA
ncbi:MAG: hypothetical protein JWM31_1029 [Solirubrobacterales bacterium]|nr:hypothetical protein [Solirubrobacterales bacterium]